jgi:hypothetical protein
MIGSFSLRYVRKVKVVNDFTIGRLMCGHRVDPVGFDVN